MDRNDGKKIEILEFKAELVEDVICFLEKKPPQACIKMKLLEDAKPYGLKEQIFEAYSNNFIFGDDTYSSYKKGDVVSFKGTWDDSLKTFRADKIILQPEEEIGFYTACRS